MERQTFSLSELNLRVKEALKLSMPHTYWIKAEISELKENYNGHCYLELIEKNSKDDSIIAKARGIIWSFTYRMIKPYFISTTKRQLEAGMNVLIQVMVEFHELYGYSLVIKDIDPAFTVGDIAIRKAQIIQQLKDEGVFDMNRQLELARVPQRLAIISSKTAAGYKDFISHLDLNPYGYAVTYKLFQSAMQGADTERSVVAALDRINQQLHRFDAVVIIRGGGAQSDLGSFDSYWLAYHITQFPIPILTGIGHEQDDSIADMVAHTRLKTPTAVAEFIISKFEEFEMYTDQLLDQINDTASNLIDTQQLLLHHLSGKIPLLIKEKLSDQERILMNIISKIKLSASHQLSYQIQKLTTLPLILKGRIKTSINHRQYAIDRLKQSILFQTKMSLNKCDNQLELIHKTIVLSDPELILKKGYSITTKDGILIKDVEKLNPGDEVETKLNNGRFKSKVL